MKITAINGAFRINSRMVRIKEATINLLKKRKPSMYVFIRKIEDANCCEYI